MLDLENLKRFRDFKFEILSLVPEWSRAYEAEESEILRQINEAHAWCCANPRRAPKKDPVRFLHNYMRIAKKMGSFRTGPPEQHFKETPVEEVMTIEEMREIRRRNMGQ